MQPTLCQYIENINEMCKDLQKYTEMLWKCWECKEIWRNAKESNDIEKYMETYNNNVEI